MSLQRLPSSVDVGGSSKWLRLTNVRRYSFICSKEKRLSTPFVKMAMSGVELDPECKIAYDSVQLGHQYRYVTFKIENGKVRIDKVRPATSSNIPSDDGASLNLFAFAEGRRRGLLRRLFGRPQAERRRGG